LTDKSGLLIDFNLDKGLEKGFLAALDYLEANGAQEEAQQLRYLYESKDFTVRIIRDASMNGAPEFDKDHPMTGMPTITWSPDIGLKYSVNVQGENVEQQLSPTSVLVDEVNSAYLYFSQPALYSIASKTKDEKYDRLIERFSIEASYSAAKKLGEVQYMREDHKHGSTYQTLGPTTNAPAP
jgi:hypothetical protein